MDTKTQHHVLVSYLADDWMETRQWMTDNFGQQIAGRYTVIHGTEHMTVIIYDEKDFIWFRLSRGV